jgi:hypothetical protein
MLLFVSIDCSYAIEANFSRTSGALIPESGMLEPIESINRAY